MNRAALKCDKREVGDRQGLGPALGERRQRQDADGRGGAEEDDRARQKASSGQRQTPRSMRLGAHAAAADRDVGAPLQIAALQGEPRHRQRHQHERQRGRLAPARRIAADGGVDAGRQEHDLRRRADDRLRPEQGKRVDGSQQRPAGDRRRDEGQIDAQRGLPALRAQHLRQLFERGVDRLQRAVGEEIREGKDMDADDEDNAGHAEDVDGPGLEAESGPQQPVELAGIGSEQDDVGERGQVGWRDVGERDQRMHDVPQGHVAARRRPCQRHAESYAHEAGAKRQLQGIDQRRVVLRAGKGALRDARGRPTAAGRARRASATAGDSRRGTAGRRPPDPSTMPCDAEPPDRARRRRSRGRLGRAGRCGRLHARPLVHTCRRPAAQLPHSPPKMLAIWSRILVLSRLYSA